MALVEVVSGKVATVIRDDQLAVNVGKGDGVEVGDTMTLYDAIKVNDPDTKKQLGTVRVPRLAFTVTLVTDTFCVGKVTTRIRPRDGNVLAAATAPLVKLTSDPLDVDARTVGVEVGEEVVIRRNEVSNAEPPF